MVIDLIAGRAGIGESPRIMLRSLVLLLLLTSGPLLWAERSGWSLPPAETFTNVVTPPPAPGSPADLADLDAVIGMQARRTPSELAHAEKSVGFDVFMFSEVRGDGFNAAAFPKTAAFFQKLEDTVNVPKNWLKDSYHRPRPYKAFPDQVKALVTIEKNYSYPSGHSLRSWLAALVMGNLDPARRADYLACAMQVNLDRIIGGMHYPSDTAAGRALAEVVYAELLSDPGFRSDLGELRKAEYSGAKQP